MCPIASSSTALKRTAIAARLAHSRPKRPASRPNLASALETDGYPGSVGGFCKLCKKGRLHEAVQALDRILKQGNKFSSYIWTCLLQGCIQKNNLVVGRQLYSLIIEHNLQVDIKLGCQLIRMFGSCGSPLEAFHVFGSLSEQNVYTWTAIILAYVQQGHIQEAIILCYRMQSSGVEPSSYTFVAILKACTSMAALDHGKLVHANIMEQGLQLDLFVGNSLVDMYAKCGSLKDACRVFDRLVVRDVVSWSAMIAGYAEHGLGQQAFQLYREMCKNSVEPDQVTFVCILKACASVAALHNGELVHADIKKRKLESCPCIGNALIDMYAKCGNIELARKVFDELHVRDIVTWNVMLAGYGEHACGDPAFQVFQKMQQEAIEPDKITLVCMLKVSASVLALDQGKLIHADIIKRGLKSDPSVRSSLVDMYAKCGSLVDASEVFSDRSFAQDIAIWNAMISGYTDHGCGKEALQLFEKVQQEGIEPNAITFASILKACASIGALGWGKLIHTDIVKRRLESDLYIGSTLVDMYMKCGNIDFARHIFFRLKERKVVSWSAMIAGYVQHGHHQGALKLFAKMQHEGTHPDKVTFMSVLKACTSLASLEQGKLIHLDIMKHGFELDHFVGSSLIDMYAKFGGLEDALEVFNSLSTHDVVSWNALIAGYAEHGHGLEALQLFKKMQQQGAKADRVTLVCVLKACSCISAIDQGKLIHVDIVKHGFVSNLSIGSTLIDMYAKCSSLEDAHRVFDELPGRDVVSWNVMIAAYIDHGLGSEALQIFKEMLEGGFEPNEGTYVCILQACTSIATLYQGRLIHIDIIKQGLESDPSLGNALVDMCAKCGSLEDAYHVFDKLLVHDTVSWSAILSAYANFGHYDMARDSFESMQLEGIRPDAVTFVSLLSACSHAGLVFEGHYHFKSMEEYGLLPTIEHYVCMVDLLGRVGLLDEAEHIVLRMPFVPDSLVWMTLLGSCATKCSLESGRRAFNFLVEFDGGSAAGYVLMANIYAAHTMWEDQQKIRVC